MMTLLLCLLLAVAFVSCRRTKEKRRFHQQYSLRSPFYLVGTELPHYEYGGGVVVNDDTIRMTPAQPNAQGWLWSKRVLQHTDWEIDIEFRVGGGGRTGCVFPRQVQLRWVLLMFVVVVVVATRSQNSIDATCSVLLLPSS